MAQPAGVLTVVVAVKSPNLTSSGQRPTKRSTEINGDEPKDDYRSLVVMSNGTTNLPQNPCAGDIFGSKGIICWTFQLFHSDLGLFDPSNTPS